MAIKRIYSRPCKPEAQPAFVGVISVVRESGHLIGSASGGYIEDDLADKVRNQALPKTPSVMEPCMSRDNAQRCRTPCGGSLQIFVDPLNASEQLQPLLNSLQDRKLVKRSLSLNPGQIK